MKLYSRKLKAAVACIVAIVTVFAMQILSYAAERPTYTVPAYKDKTVFIGLAVFVVVLIAGTCIIGFRLRKAQNEAHKRWLEENHMTEEELNQQAKEYKLQEKQRKADLKRKKKARKEALKAAKKF